MSYVIEQKIEGRVYLYEVQAYWDKEKKQARQKRRYLGRKDTITGEVSTPQKSVLPKTIYGYGANYVLDHIATEIGLKEELKKRFGTDSQQILAWLYYKVSEAGSAYLFESWLEDNYLPFTLKNMNSARISEWLKEIANNEGRCTAFLKGWTKRHKEDTGVWFDITSLSSYAQGNNWLEWGYNRDGESLPQINLGMVMGSISRLPLSYEIYPGSISDVSTLKNIVLKQKTWHRIIKTFIVDRGFYSASNLAEMHRLSIHFVMPLPAQVKQANLLINSCKKEIQSPLSSILFEGKPLFAVKQSYELNGVVLYATLFFDERRYADESTRFYKRLNELEERIHQGTFYSIAQVDEALESAWAGSSRYFIIRLLDTKVQLQRKRNAISWRLNRMGKMILVSDQDHEPTDLLKWYRQKDCLEKAFDTLKNELDEQRLKVHSEKAMHGKMFLNFLATILHTAMQNKIQDTALYKRYTLPEVMAYIKKWRLVELSNRKYVFAELSKKQRDLLAALNISVPVDHRY
jgi:transposase